MHSNHDHSHCQSQALFAAESACDKQETRLTPSRRKVLELLWEDHRPMKAYDLLSRLQEESPSAKPPTVYRALDFLLEQGLIHKIERLNAYVGCHHPLEAGSCYFLICTECGDTEEIHQPAIAQILQQTLRDKDFTAKRISLEIEGICGGCGV